MIRIANLHFSAGAFALDDLSLDVADGEYFVLLGPSGSGKTMLLECLCGLNRLAGGQIVIDDHDVTHLEPRRRGIGYLPQDYGLFPHLSVRNNIRFGLRRRDVDSTTAAARVEQLLAQFELVRLADRLPERLSGGEKQRVALARALAIQPRVLLLDEPVSAVDEFMRDRLCRRLKRLQQATQTTVLHVCHNFDEMLAVADRVAVIQDGRILQVDTPADILRRPNSPDVARFVRAGNLFPVAIEPSESSLRVRLTPVIEFSMPLACIETEGEQTEGILMIRPEDVRVETTTPNPEPVDTLVLDGAIRQIRQAGALVYLLVGCRDLEVLASITHREFSQLELEIDRPVHLMAHREDVHLMPSP